MTNNLKIQRKLIKYMFSARLRNELFISKWPLFEVLVIFISEAGYICGMW